MEIVVSITGSTTMELETYTSCAWISLAHLEDAFDGDFTLQARGLAYMLPCARSARIHEAEPVLRVQRICLLLSAAIGYQHVSGQGSRMD